MSHWKIVRSEPTPAWSDGLPESAPNGSWVHLILDGPSPVNALSSAVMQELSEKAVELRTFQGVAALLIWSAKKEHFIAGADIAEIAGLTDVSLATAAAAEGQRIFGQLHELPFPTFAMIRGTCLGGGLELALALDYRVAAETSSTKIGLPEVNLGIIPGFGGCQRLPRLIGITRALPLILAGKRLPAKLAQRRGIVDALVPPEGFHAVAGRAVAQILAAPDKVAVRRRKLRGRIVRWLFEENPIGRRFVEKRARAQVAGLTAGNYPAPPAAITAVIDGYSKDLAAGLQLEAKLCGELIASDVCKNLISIFNSSEDARKLRVGDEDDTNAPSQPTDKAAVIGAGVMGAGIAQMLLSRGCDVRLRDLDSGALAKGLRTIAKLVEAQVKKRRLSPREQAELLSRLTHTTDLVGFAQLDVVVEAIVERLDIKQAALRELEAQMRPDTVFATNTSALSISSIQEGAEHPERVVGMHFFNPVHKMPLVEVIPGSATADWAVERVLKLTQRLGKYPILVQDSPGFLVNRLLAPLLNSACQMLEEGASGVEVDRVAVAFGLPMGPFRLLDEVGIDIGVEVSETLSAAFGSRVTPSPVLQKVLDRGDLGRKGGSGFYAYGGDGAPAWLDKNEALQNGGRHFDREQIVHRLLDPLLDEAARCLEEGIIDRPSVVDLGMVMGTGFPPFRGGPLRYADAVGLPQLLQRLEQRHDEGDPRTPCELLQELVRGKNGFYSLEPGAGSATTRRVEPAAP
ncbi:MAG: 3-hydroxyacyl-CoA dehydrogenase NAD-binding domain-containing protein [Planctomycetota bacterium]